MHVAVDECYKVTAQLVLLALAPGKRKCHDYRENITVGIVQVERL